MDILEKSTKLADIAESRTSEAMIELSWLNLSAPQYEQLRHTISMACLRTIEKAVKLERNYVRENFERMNAAATSNK